MNITDSSFSLLQFEIEKHLGSKLIVPAKLSEPHKLIVAAAEALNRKDQYVQNGFVSTGRENITISVTRPNISRALRFMDTMIKCLYARGHHIEVKNGDTYVHIGENDFKINLRETTRREVIKKNTYDSSVYHPTGQLAFHMHGWQGRDWIDGKVLLEDQIAKIITKLELAERERRQLRIQANKSEEVRKEKERLLQEQQMLRQKELTDFKEMLEKSSRWHKAINLRNYIDALEKNNTSDEWINWARKKADWYDPFVEATDELLNDVDKETLAFKNRKL